MTDAAEPVVQPVTVSVVSGNPTDEELAALVALLSARSAATAAAASQRRTASEWAAPRYRMRAAVRRRPDGWRFSALPH